MSQKTTEVEQADIDAVADAIVEEMVEVANRVANELHERLDAEIKKAKINPSSVNAIRDLKILASRLATTVADEKGKPHLKDDLERIFLKMINFTDLQKIQRPKYLQYRF